MPGRGVVSGLCSVPDAGDGAGTASASPAWFGRSSCRNRSRCCASARAGGASGSDSGLTVSEPAGWSRAAKGRGGTGAAWISTRS